MIWNENFKFQTISPLADFLPTLAIKVKDFATELTSHTIVNKNFKGEAQISKEHVDNTIAVRKMLKARVVLPEHLPALEDLKKVQRQLDSDEKKMIKAAKKNKK